MWISVASGKGGTGKTTVAVSLALSNRNTIYVDADVEEPNGFLFIKPVIKEEFSYTELIPLIHQNKCTFCGKCADACVYKAIAILKPVKKAIFFPELCHSCGLCSFVCPVEDAIEEVPKEKGKIRKGEKNGQLFIEGILNGNESRKKWLLSEMAFAARKHKRNSNYQFWTHENHAVELSTNEMLDQRLKYLHQNPVVAGLVENAEDYLYSSARNYCENMNCLMEVDLLE